MTRKTARQILGILEALSKTGAVVIGGQAINIWAENYSRNESPWTSLQPYTSADLDAMGTRNDVLHCAHDLGTKPFFPEPGENTVNTGKIVVPLDGENFDIDFLHTANGLNTQEVYELARPLIFEGIRLRILHPIHCLESKTANLATLPQSYGDRQDEKHLKLALAICREYLRQQTVGGASSALLLRWAGRIRANANHQLGLEVAIQYGIDYQEALPKANWEQSSGPLRDFITNEWSQWQREVAQKVEEQLEINRWIAELKQKPTA